jgi:hypothetical protein
MSSPLYLYAHQVYGAILLYNHPYLPKMYGGGAECDIIVKDWPYLYITEDLKKYYMIMLAHHFYSLLELIVGLRDRTDGPEMILHHVATVSLMLFSYYTNHCSGGITLLTAHNVGDIMINLAKFARDLKIMSSTVANLVFVALFTSWFVPRCVMIFICILSTMFKARIYGNFELADARAGILL